jgi:hypothetical protein
MYSLRWSPVVGLGVLTLFLSLPSIAKSCPRRGAFARGGYSYQTYSMVGLAYPSYSGARETRVPDNGPDRLAASSPGRVIPAAAVSTVGAPSSPPRVAPLSEQSGNDNFGNSGQ